MVALDPSFLWLALLALPLIALYTWRRRRVTVRVPALMLWRGIAAPPRRVRPFGPDPRSLPLLLFLLALAGLTGGAAGVVWGEGAPRDLVVVVDVSGSMASRGRAASRLEEARARARGLLDALGPEDRGWLIAAGTRPRLVSGPGPAPAGADWATLLPQEGAGADLSGALRLADTLLRLHGSPDRAAEVALLSDGCPARTVLAPEVRLLHVAPPPGRENVALEATLTREDHGLRLAATLVHRAGDQPVERGLLIEVGGSPLLALPPEPLGPGERRALPALSVPLPTGVTAATVEARLVGGSDDHPLDDARAWVVEPRPRLFVLRLGPPQRFLDAALAADPEVVLLGPDAAEEPTVQVVTSAPATRRPGVPTLLVAPGALGGEVGLAAAPGAPYAGAVQTSAHPLLARLPLGPLLLAARPEVSVAAESGWRAIARAGEAPLLLVREREGAREVALTFAPASSDLALRRELPLLVAAALRWAADRPEEAPRWLRTGQTVSGLAAGRYELPGGAHRTVSAETRALPLLLAAPPGALHLGGVPALALHPDPAETELEVAPTAPGARRLAWSARPPPARRGPRTPWLALALAALALEAALFHAWGLP